MIVLNVIFSTLTLAGLGGLVFGVVQFGKGIKDFNELAKDSEPTEELKKTAKFIKLVCFGLGFFFLVQALMIFLGGSKWIKKLETTYQ